MAVQVQINTKGCELIMTNAFYRMPYSVCALKELLAGILAIEQMPWKGIGANSESWIGTNFSSIGRPLLLRNQYEFVVVLCCKWMDGNVFLLSR